MTEILSSDFLIFDCISDFAIPLFFNIFVMVEVAESALLTS